MRARMMGLVGPFESGCEHMIYNSGCAVANFCFRERSISFVNSMKERSRSRRTPGALSNRLVVSLNFRTPQLGTKVA